MTEGQRKWWKRGLVGAGIAAAGVGAAVGRRRLRWNQFQNAAKAWEEAERVIPYPGRGALRKPRTLQYHPLFRDAERAAKDVAYAKGQAAIRAASRVPGRRRNEALDALSVRMERASEVEDDLRSAWQDANRKRRPSYPSRSPMWKKSSGMIMGYEQLHEMVTELAFLAAMQKRAQEDGRPPLAALAEDVATPAAFGTAGYYLSKHFGLGGETGLPDWFTGPALGLGVAMPMLRDYLKPKRRTSDQQIRLEQQAQAMLASPVEYQMGGYGGPKYGSLREAFEKVGQKPTGFRVPGDSAEQVAQRGQQTVQQTAQQQQQQQMQQAVAASVAKGYLSSLQQKQKPQAQPAGGRR